MFHEDKTPTTPARIMEVSSFSDGSHKVEVRSESGVLISRMNLTPDQAYELSYFMGNCRHG